MSLSIKILLRTMPKFHLISCSGNFAIGPKLCGNCAFPQNFHTKKVGEITVFYVVFKDATN